LNPQSLAEAQGEDVRIDLIRRFGQQRTVMSFYSDPKYFKYFLMVKKSA
jgi:hypothetical protein